MTREDIYQLLPEHLWLKDNSLRKKCADVWVEVLDNTDWTKKNRLHECPIAVGPLDPACPEDNISHTRLVVQLCNVVYDAMKDYFNKIGYCNKDLLLAAALVHDVGKFFEYAPTEDGATIPEFGLMFRHPCYGAYLAQKYGLPEKVVHAVLSHSLALSPEGKNAYCTPESLLMKYLDDMVYNYAKLFYPFPN